MLDAKDRGERHREPERGKARRETETIGRIGECDVECAGLERGGESECIGAVNHGGVPGARNSIVTVRGAIKRNGGKGGKKA